jgi:predicted Rossmann fold flavoprotein
VRIETECVVRGVKGSFELDIKGGGIEAESLVIASGGLSIPKIGATPFGYGVAKQFGLKIVPHRPALVPLTFGEEDLARYGGLAGVSADAVVRAGGPSFREKLLFTHRGLSGPAILQGSSYWKRGSAIEIDLLPDIDIANELRARGRAEPRTVISRFVARRLADAHTPALDDVEAIAAAYQRWQITPAGTEGYEKAEVTAGGVDTAELSSKTFEAKKVPGLYFIGEVVDVTGQLGGFNFQWAWASGYSAGQFV